MKKIIKHVFTETGEVRPVQKGEYYLENRHNPGVNLWWQYGDSKEKYPICTYNQIEEEWKPKLNKKYFCISTTGEIIKYIYDELNVDKERYNFGNCFPTKEEAESKLKQIKEILK